MLAQRGYRKRSEAEEKQRGAEEVAHLHVLGCVVTKKVKKFLRRPLWQERLIYVKTGPRSWDAREIFLDARR